MLKHVDLPNINMICYVNGSWTKDWKGGIGYAISQQGILQLYVSVGATVCAPLQAEVQALKEVKTITEMGATLYTFLTDNSHLVTVSAATQPPLDFDWRAYYEILEV